MGCIVRKQDTVQIAVSDNGHDLSSLSSKLDMFIADTNDNRPDEETLAQAGGIRR